MDFKELIGKTRERSIEQFWKAMNIWLNNPHLVNRRISSSINLLTIEIQCDSTSLIDNFWSSESIFKITESILQGDTAEKILKIVDKYNPVVCTFGSLETRSKGVYLLVNKSLPRDSEKFSAGIEFTIVDKSFNCILTFHRNENEKIRWLGLKNLYKISYDNNRFSISVEKNANEKDPSIRWLTEQLFPRLLKWTESDGPKDDALIEGSLNLISPEKYAILYGELKRKYGLEMVKKWPECTDPNKFVYEDVAIATYLILLWEKERQDNNKNKKKQSFLDLGCGNGLLVHILANEGYSGRGIDLRKRQIWGIYPSTTRLEERTIVPSSSSLFPDVDWLIGNHSDELTPWIPVIAARSSYSCRFFLLPCCAHEFDGRKFQRDSAARSQYYEYIKYIKSVSEGCGFKTELDKLRIPSTKRICLIGTTRNYPEVETQSQDKIIQEIINARSSRLVDDATNNETSMDQWSRDFKPREIIEKVRNCTQLDKTIIIEIINIVSSHLLRKVRRISIDQKEKTWNAGGQVELSEIAKIVPSETLKKLRNECGGLQTLLKNNGHIFQVVNGMVQFRIPGTEKTNNKKKRKNKLKIQTKVKPCWFHANHPDGCPAEDELCNFKH